MRSTTAVAVCLLLVGCGNSPPSVPPGSAPATIPGAAFTPSPLGGTRCLEEMAPPDAIPGARWEVDALTSIQFVTRHRGWAAGRGYILGTDNGGSTWSTQYEGPAQVTSVDFVNDSTGWATALDRLLATTDGGRCWTQREEPDQPLVSVHFIDERRGWGVMSGRATHPGRLPDTPVIADSGPVQPAGGRLVVTTDGGLSWRAVPGTPLDVQSVCFSDPGHGWLGADGGLYRSGDGGASWRVVPGLPHGVGGGVVSLQCAAPDTVWVLDLSLEGAAGNQPYAAYASTGGGPLVELFDDMFGGAVDRPAPGSYPGPLSVISPTTAAFAGFTPALPTNPVGFEEATVIHGAVSITHETHVPGIERARGAAFLDPTTGWLVAGAGSDDVILATTDGGRTWTRQYSTSG